MSQPSGLLHRVTSASSAKVADVRVWVQPHVIRIDESVVGRWYSRMLELEIVDRSVALAAKLFVSFFPFVLGLSSLLPASMSRSIRISLVNRFGLSGDAEKIVAQAFASAGQTRAATGVLGVLLLFFYATSFTTALQRIFLLSWRRPPGGGVRNQGRGLSWLGGTVALFGLNAFLARLLLGTPGAFARILVGLVTTTALWWWTAHTMLRSEVRWRPLLPGAILTSVAMTAYFQASRLWMPQTVRSNSAQFGFFGVALSLVSWFLGMSFAIIAVSALNPVLLEGDGALARWLRGRDGQVLAAGAAAPLAGPTRRLQLIDSLGLRGR